MEKISIENFYIECSCGCSVLQFSHWKGEPTAFIQYLLSGFSASQKGRWDRIKNGFKAFWNLVVLDKEYTLYEIVIEDNEKLKEFKAFVASMKEIEEV